jgi:hypothetical protein
MHEALGSITNTTKKAGREKFEENVFNVLQRTLLLISHDNLINSRWYMPVIPATREAEAGGS